jgi:hypothetical protein
VAPPGKGIHIAQCPEKWRAQADLPKELPVIDEPGDPLQMNNIMWRELPRKVVQINRPIIAKHLIALSSQVVVLNAPADTFLSNATHYFVDQAIRVLICNNRWIIATASRHKQRRVVAQMTQPTMDAIGSACSATIALVCAHMYNLHRGGFPLLMYHAL